MHKLPGCNALFGAYTRKIETIHFDKTHHVLRYQTPALDRIALGNYWVARQITTIIQVIFTLFLPKQAPDLFTDYS